MGGFRTAPDFKVESLVAAENPSPPCIHACIAAAHTHTQYLMGRGLGFFPSLYQYLNILEPCNGPASLLVWPNFHPSTLSPPGFVGVGWTLFHSSPLSSPDFWRGPWPLWWTQPGWGSQWRLRCCPGSGGYSPGSPAPQCTAPYSPHGLKNNTHAHKVSIDIDS